MHLAARLAIATLLVLAAASIRADEVPFAIDSAGEGRPVYLIPGLSNAGDVWDDLAARLRVAGYRAHVPTRSGFGGRPPLEGGPLLPRVRDALAAELESGSGPKLVVIGHSLGGFLAFWLGAERAADPTAAARQRL